MNDPQWLARRGRPLDAACRSDDDDATRPQQLTLAYMADLLPGYEQLTRCLGAYLRFDVFLDFAYQGNRARTRTPTPHARRARPPRAQPTNRDRAHAVPARAFMRAPACCSQRCR